LSHARATDLLFRIGHEDFSRLPSTKTVTGKQIFSCLLPKDFTFDGVAKNKQKITIRNGLLTAGVMDSLSLGSGKGFLIRKLHKDYGHVFTAEFIGKVARLGIEALSDLGFSAAISDADLPTEARQRIADIIAKANVQVTDLIVQMRAGDLESLPGRNVEETLEVKVMEILNKARNSCGDVVSQVANKKSGMLVMTESGAKGNMVNIAQMASSVGQQAISGKRISRGYANRTLSCFAENDLGSEARGFIANSFKSGLTPNEFFFASMTGRDSLMDTALRTPKSGYLYRRLENSMQDLKIGYDLSVRDANEHIIQFKYGDDGVDVSKSEGGAINVKQIISKVLSN
jgi:DNA-directed RNA polymerase subunit A'